MHAASNDGSRSVFDPISRRDARISESPRLFRAFESYVLDLLRVLGGVYRIETTRVLLSSFAAEIRMLVAGWIVAIPPGGLRVLDVLVATRENDGESQLPGAQGAAVLRF